MADAALATQGLTKFYGKVRGIENVTIVVPQGRVFGFLGPNGAGKTTFIRTVMGLLHPTAGRMRLLGRDPVREGVELRRRIGYLPGEFSPYNHLTGAQFLRYMARLRGHDAAGGDALAGRLRCVLDRRIRELSSGNKQKLGVVQAFMHEPELLILDEPTIALDPLMQEEVHLLIQEVRAQGRTVFLSSHILPEVEEVCDRVAVVRDGRVARVADVGELKLSLPRRFSAELGIVASKGDLELVPGVRNVTVDRYTVHGSVEGPIGPLLQHLARWPIRDFHLQEPSLEEAFMEYYAEANRADA